MKDAVLIVAIIGALVGVGFLIGRALGKPAPVSLLIGGALFCPPVALGLFLGGKVSGNGASPRSSDPLRPLPAGMIRTTFQAPASGETTSMQWAYLIGGPVVGGALGGVLGGMLGLLIGALLIVVSVKTSAQQVVRMTLETDGQTLWGYNDRIPDVQRKGVCKLFALPLDQVGACESGKAYDLFGSNQWFGSLRVLGEHPVADTPRRALEKQMRAETTAIFLRCRSGLVPIYAGHVVTSLIFEMTTGINEFLADARALHSASPVGAAASGNPSSAAPSPAAAPSGFDL
jgi:hypothetical protein